MHKTLTSAHPKTWTMHPDVFERSYEILAFSLAAGVCFSPTPMNVKAAFCAIVLGSVFAKESISRKSELVGCPLDKT